MINNRSESARIGILVDWDAGDWHDFRLIGEILGGQDWVECVGLIAEAPDPSDERFNCIMRSRIKVGHPEFPKLVAMPRERFCVVSPLGRRFIGNKFWMVAFRLPELRLIFKERLGSYYSVLDSVIPRTGVLRRGSVLFPDEEMGVELLNRKEWILKPPAGSSGRGIVIGRSTSQKKWIEICYSSGANGAVIQEYFRVKEDVDVLGKSGVPTKIRAYTKYGAFLYGGQVAACEVNVRCQPLVHGTRDTYLSFTLWGDLEKSDR